MKIPLLKKNRLLVRKCVKVVIVLAVLIQLSMSSYYITRWFQGIVNTYFTYLHLPKEDRIFTTSLDEYFCILYIRKNLPEDANILWIPKASHFVNYYIYPRKIFQIKEHLDNEKIEVDKDFLKKRDINYIFFDYNKIYPLSDLDIIDNLDKVIITRK
ncbi:MAG: hypothetical protein HQ538_01805 [Parcubacteria group bacterium]|nr:hypothetical protein [Parcubacteria group bacterium]